MRILLLSFYYTPDIGPGSLRAKSIVDALVSAGEQSIEIDIFTTIPNRYQSHSVEVGLFDQSGSVSVRRIPLPQHQNGMVGHARAFFIYAKEVLKISQGQKWDVVVATSSRLMTASLGAFLSTRQGARLYFDIRDLFVDTMADVLSKSPLRLLMPTFRALECWTFRKADQLNVVSAGFLPYVSRHRPSMKPTVFTNGIDDEFLAADFSCDPKNNIPLVLYAGNIGEGQGLHYILPPAAKLLEGEVSFLVIGDGGERKNLDYEIRKSSVKNIETFDPIARSELLNQYRSADVLFLHLNEYKAFHKVLPSKIFEYAATGKPILAGVSGFAAKFLEEEVPGVEVFEPCDIQGMKKGLKRLLKGPRIIDRTDFCRCHLRLNIMREMAVDILSLQPRFS